jgi:hypothetical protein
VAHQGCATEPQNGAPQIRVFLGVKLRLAFVFHLDFCLDLVLSLHQGVFGDLVNVGIHKKELFQKGLNSVGKEKKFHAKKWCKKDLVWIAA